VTAARSARRGRDHLVRLAVDAADLGTRPVTRRALLDAVDAALEAGALPATYALPDPRAGVTLTVPVPRVSSGALHA
jgi:hypothetical protein